MKLADIQRLQVARRKPILDQTAGELPTPTVEQQPEESSSSSNPLPTPPPAAAPVPVPPLVSGNTRLATLQSMQQSVVLPSRPGGPLPPLMVTPMKANLPHVVLAEVPMSARLLKLKAELMSIFCILPESSLRWGPEVDTIASSSTAVAVVTDEKLVSNGSEQTEEEQKMALLNQLAARNKKASEWIITKVRSAGSAKELFEVVNFILSAIPAAYLVDFDINKLPRSSTSLAAVAVRIYAIDRALKYEDWKGIEQSITVSDKPFRPRVSFCPRCVGTVTCVRFLCHEGRCSNPVDQVTRFPELNDAVGMVTYPHSSHSHISQPNNATSSSISSNANQAAGALDARSKRARGIMDDDDDRIAKRPTQPLPASAAINNNAGLLAGGLQGADADSIENVQPYYPAAHEVTMAIWV